MSGKGPTGMKVQRIRKMEKMIRGVGDVDLIKFIATCEYSMGLTEPTIRKYLSTLEKIGFIEIDGVQGIVREVPQDE